MKVLLNILYNAVSWIAAVAIVGFGLLAVGGLTGMFYGVIRIGFTAALQLFPS